MVPPRNGLHSVDASSRSLKVHGGLYMKELRLTSHFLSVSNSDFSTLELPIRPGSMSSQKKTFQVIIRESIKDVVCYHNKVFTDFRRDRSS